MLQESELVKPVRMHFKLLEVISMKRFFLNFIISFFMMLSFQNLHADNHEMVSEEPVVEAESALNSGDTAWMITATVLVIAMTIPGLALFYGGLVRAKNMLSVLMQVFVTFCLMAVIWILWGYSLAATEGNAFIGDLSKMFLKGVTPDSMSGSIPEYVFIGFQLTFACITPALIVGAFAERIKFSAVLLFMALWMTICYTPVWHWVWGGGFLSTLMGIGAVDFAGGTVVHINAGVAALVGALLLGPRIGYGKEAMPPHNLPFTMIGASLLWVGWFGFNVGSELAADGVAGLVLVNTIAATGAAVLGWLLIESLLSGKATMLGAATGAGLALEDTLTELTPLDSAIERLLSVFVAFFFLSSSLFLAASFLLSSYCLAFSFSAFSLASLICLAFSISTLSISAFSLASCSLLDLSISSLSLSKSASFLISAFLAV